MLNRDLLRDAVRLMGDGKPHGKFVVTRVTVDSFQRRVRVGFATAMVMTQALADAGVLGPHSVRTNGRQVLAHDLDAAYALVDEAIEDGRIELTTVDTETNPSAVDRG